MDEDVLKAIGTILTALKGSKDVEKEEALENEEAESDVDKIFKIAREYGRYRGKEAKDALGEKLWSAIEVSGGWQKLCSSDMDELHVKRAEIETALKSLDRTEKAIGTKITPSKDPMKSGFSLSKMLV